MEVSTAAERGGSPLRVTARGNQVFPRCLPLRLGPQLLEVPVVRAAFLPRSTPRLQRAKAQE